MKAPKWVWLLLALALLACGAIGYVAINLGSYLTANREIIAERVSRTLGRTVRFDRLELSVGRGLGIAVRELAIAEDPRFGDGDFVTTHGAFVQIRILPALFGRYEVARVSLESPAISVVKTADGVNLETLSTGDSESGDTSSARSRAIAVALLDIENATVRYVDRTQRPAHEIEVSRLDFQASDLSFGDAVRFELSAAVLGAPSPNITASGAVGPVDPADVAATPLDLVFQLDGVDGSALQPVLPAGAELRLEGPLTAKLEVGGTVEAWTLNFLLNLGRSRVAYGSVVDKAHNVDLTVSGHLERRADDSIVAESVEIVTTSSKLTLVATVTPRETTTAYAIELDATGVSLADLASLSPALRDTGVKGHADVALDVAKPFDATAPSIDGRIGLDGIGARPSEGTAEISQLSGILAFKGKSATLAPADLRVGGAPARLAARVHDVFAPVVVFELSSAALPLAVVMPGAGDDALREVAVSGRLALTKRSPELEADVRAAGGTIRGVAMTNLHARVAHAESGTRIDPLSFDSCGGNLRGSLRRAAGPGSSRAARIELDVVATRVSIAEFAAAVTGTDGSAPATGVITFELAAAGAGDDWPSLRTALDGRGRFDIADGALLGVNVPEAALERITGVPGLAALLPPRLRTAFPGLFGQKDTHFDSLAASFRFADGRLRTQDLAVKAPDFAIDADGTIGLDLSVDLSAMLTTSPALSSRLVAEADAVKLLTNREGSVTIPFRLAGTLPGVKPQPDVPALAARLQRGILGALGEKLLGGEKKKQPEAPTTP
jgi:AsmA protein